MFESLEDMIEESVELNMRSLPILEGISQILVDVKNPEFLRIKEEIIAVATDLQIFVSKIESSVDEETGEIDLGEYKDRQFH